jgi:hypothetical protein
MSHNIATRFLVGATIAVAIGCSGSEFSERGAGGGSDASAGSSSGGSAGIGAGAAGGVGGSASGGGGGTGVGGGAGKGGSGGIAGSGGISGTGGIAASGGSGGIAGSGGSSASGGTSGSGGGAGCEPACTFGLTCCSGRCVNTANDILNCGSCGLTCNQLNPHCLSGKCDVPVCFGGIGCIGEQVCCGDVCCGGGTGKICCDIQGPGPSTGPRCVDPVNGTCPIGCPGCQ